LIAASVPVICTVSVPLPFTTAPPSAATASVPWSTLSVVLIAPPSASGSVIASPVMARLWFASRACVTGTLFTGASFTALMTIAKVWPVTGALKPSLTEKPNEVAVVSLPSWR